MPTFASSHLPAAPTRRCDPLGAAPTFFGVIVPVAVNYCVVVSDYGHREDALMSGEAGHRRDAHLQQLLLVVEEVVVRHAAEVDAVVGQEGEVDLAVRVLEADDLPNR